MNKILFPGITLLLLLLIPLTFFGFNPTYFSKLFKVEFVYHAHALLMMLWVVMAIVQPILIKKKKTMIHKRIGRVSYFIMPVLFVTSYMVIRHTYYKFISSQTTEAVNKALALSTNEIYSAAASYIMIGVIYIAWLFVFYSLAVIYRKKIVYHSTYMFAAILTLLGPTIDRIMYQITMYFGGSFNVFVENAVFVFILLILSALVIYQRRKNTTIKPAVVSLALYVIGIVIYHLLPKLPEWGKIIKLVMYNS